MMPRAAKQKSEIDPSGTYVCWQSGVALVDGEEFSFHAGERLRGDSPLVQATARFWTLDGNEVPTHWDTLVERNEADRPPVPEHDALVVLEPVLLEREDVRTLNREVAVLVGPGQEKKQVTYQAGTVFDARSELCGVLPDAFEPEDSHIQFTKPKGRRR
jgi:hypothetical protein